MVVVSVSLSISTIVGRRSIESHGGKPTCLPIAQDNQSWLELFAEYMAIKEHFDNLAWTEWPDADARARKASTLESYREKLADNFACLPPRNSISLLPTMVEIESIRQRLTTLKSLETCLSMWLRTQAICGLIRISLKQMKTEKRLTLQDAHQDDVSADGQLWGNPIYDWEAMDKDGYKWWIERLRESFKIYDIVRIDHFRGFESYWEIPAGSETAAPGKWVKGPGYKLFAAVKEELGDLNIIAEDLGFMTDEVIELRERTGFPGMKILQFAFNPDDESIDSPHLAPNNSVMYTGTHDNNTVLGWYRNEIDDPTREYLARYTNRKEYESVPHAMLRTVFASVSFMAIATMQDLLELDGSARMNFPSTLGGNWSWRMTADQLTPAVEQELLDFTTIYRREKQRLEKRVKKAKKYLSPY